MKLLKQNDTFSGQVIAHPELRYTASGNPICTFAILQENEVPLVCEAWNELAETIIERDMEPGAKVELIGSMRIRKFTDREDNPREYPYLSVTKIGL